MRKSERREGERAKRGRKGEKRGKGNKEREGMPKLHVQYTQRNGLITDYISAAL